MQATNVYFAFSLRNIGNWRCYLSIYFFSTEFRLLQKGVRPLSCFSQWFANVRWKAKQWSELPLDPGGGVRQIPDGKAVNCLTFCQSSYAQYQGIPFYKSEEGCYEFSFTNPADIGTQKYVYHSVEGIWQLLDTSPLAQERMLAGKAMWEMIEFRIGEIIYSYNILLNLN